MMLKFCCRSLYEEEGGGVLTEEGLAEVTQVLALKEHLHPRLPVDSRARGMQAGQMMLAWTTFRLDGPNEALLESRRAQAHLGRELAQQGQVLASVFRVVAANPEGARLTVRGFFLSSHWPELDCLE